jgi:hypothetical protein
MIKSNIILRRLNYLDEPFVVANLFVFNYVNLVNLMKGKLNKNAY